MQNNNIKRLKTSLLAGTIFISMTIPAFAQNYDYDYGYDYNEQNTTDDQQYQAPQNQYNTPQHNYQHQPVQNQNFQPLQGHVVTVPPGTVLPDAITTRTLSSQNLRTGDTIHVLMNSPFYYGGTMVLPAGTNIAGTVVMAESAGRAGKHGKLMIVFNQAITPSGQRLPLSGKIATDDGTGVLKGGTGTDRVKTVAKDAAVGSGAGALMGVVFGALSGGSKGQGAALGTAVGGGTGIAKSIINKGNEVMIEVGEKLNIILESELRTGGDQMVSPMLPELNPNYDYEY